MHQMNRSTKQYKRKIISGEKGNIKDANKEILKMQTKKFKLGLVPKLIIAIIAGILIGQFLPEEVCRVVVTLSGFFSSFLKFIIPLMILAYVTMGIADLSQGAGKLLLITVALAYGSTLIAGSCSYLVSSVLFPHFMSEGALDQIAAAAGVSVEGFSGGNSYASDLHPGSVYRSRYCG